MQAHPTIPAHTLMQNFSGILSAVTHKLNVFRTHDDMDIFPSFGTRGADKSLAL
jgi:hypothetical protein